MVRPVTRQRQQAVQQTPDTQLALADFPNRRLDRRRRVYREHGQLGAWYFAAGQNGRFNLDSPRGALYLAASRECAARERIGGDFDSAGFDGLWTTLRFSIPDGRGLAIFEVEGPRPELPADERPSRLRTVVEAMGIKVDDPPHEDELTVIFVSS